MDQDRDSMSNVESTITPELYFLIYKFLSAGPCQRAAQAIHDEIEQYKLMPKRTDWLGNQHARTLEDVDRSHPHVSSDHLVKICSRIGSILDKEVPPSVGGVASLLGAGKQSLLRRKNDPPRKLTVRSLVAQLNGAPVLPPANHLPNYPSGIANMLISREYRGSSTVRQTFSCKLYQKQMMYRRLLGHLSSVYCILFDRTGQYIFTGADDLLVKIWSARDGRLLSTLRGHAKEISDLAVNYENTLIAAGSCDRTIRIWCLKTTSPKCVLTGHQNDITSVKFCPLVKNGKSYLVSTANDGCVCFWRWDVDTHEFETPNKPTHKFIERTKPGVHILCSSFSSGGVFLAVGSTDHFVRVYHVNAVNGPEKVLEIEVHSNQVDSIQFSNLGYRFISGSKDGNAHIWWYERQTWRSHLLKMTERLPCEPPLIESDLSKIKVNMVGWNCDDTFVVTSASDHSVKVWNPLTGKLLHSLKGHEDEVFVLEAHPHDPRIMLSAGHDGRIILWDLTQGVPVKKLHNLIEGQGHGAIFDCKWSPDGQQFASTDSHGHITLFGFGSNERYQKVPEHVFFHTDYRPLIRDTNNYVIDEQTQCPPHLMSPPFLVDIDGNPHPPALQRLVPGRENDSEERLVPHVAVHNERGVNEILVAADENDGPDANQQDQQENVPDNRPTIDDMIQRLQEETQRERVNREHGYASGMADQQPEASRNNNQVNQRRSVDGQPAASVAMVGIRRAGDVEGVRQATHNWQSRDSSGNVPVYSRRTVVKPLPSNMVSSRRLAAEEHGIFETLLFNRENKKSAFEQPTMRTDTTKGKFTRRKRRMIQQRQGVRSTNRSLDSIRARSLTNRRHPGAIDYDHPEENMLSDSGSNGSASGAESWAETGSTSSESSSSDSDDAPGWGDDGPSTSRGKKSKSKDAARAKKPAAGSGSESGDNDASEAASDEENSRSSASSGRSAKSKKSTASQPETSKKAPKPAPKPKVPKTPKLSAKTEEKWIELNSKEMPDKFKLPEWLTSITPKRTPYFPQLHDEIVYFRQGHNAYFEEVKKQNMYTLKQQHLGVFRRKNIPDIVFAKVVDIEFDCLPPRIVCLTLSFLKDSSHEQFKIYYHDIPNVIDFVILKQHFDTSISRKWSVRNRFRSLIDNKWWLGTVEDVLDTATPYQSLSVQWDNGECEVMCPWDLEMVDEARVPEHGEGIAITAEEQATMLYQPQASDWPECGQEAESERIIAGLTQIMTISAAENFIAPVDLTEMPVYGMMISYVIDLSMVRTRIENKFYRRKDAIIHDVKFIETNAKTFNDPMSDIVLNAKMITELCVRFISDCNCTDPMAIFAAISSNKEMFVPTESEDEEAKEEVMTNSGRTSTSKRRSKVALSKTRAKKQLEIERCEITSRSWKPQCKELIDGLFGLADSEPFRFPVDPIVYPDYNRVIQNPMDLNTVREQLMSDSYDTPQELKKEFQLIFKNAKEYTPSTRSKIHSMTLRMSALVDEKFAEIISDYKSALLHERRGKPGKAKSKFRSPLSDSKKKSKGKSKRKPKHEKKSEADDDDYKPGPSTSGAAEPIAGQSNGTIGVRKRIRISSGEEAGCSGTRQVPDKQENGGGDVKSSEFYKQLVQSESEDDDDFRPSTAASNVSYGTDIVDNHADSDTEVEDDKLDSDATEIEEELDGLASVVKDQSKRKGTKRKVVTKNGKGNGAPKRRKRASESSVGSLPSEEDFSEASGVSEESLSSLASEDLDDGSDYGDAKPKRRAPKKTAKKKNGARTSGRKTKSRFKHVDNDGSDFEYEGMNGFAGDRVSSRGRVIKNKHATRAKAC
ncbi:Bromodomain and WD repeat-containing protein 1 [Halotydeus destructor]|nr:Bromodomain and WD repeat-containing protein 1 [Halotydeus destructor]